MESVLRSLMQSLTTSAEKEHKDSLVSGAWMIAFAGLTAVGAQVAIPHHPVPYTLQTLFVLLAGAFLGGRNGSMSQLLYLAIGLAGGPVFAGMSGGLMILAGPSGGYLLSFPFAAMLVGLLLRKRRGYLWTLLSMGLGLLVIFTVGTAYLDLFFLHNLRTAFAEGFFIFSWWDLLKLLAATAVYREVAKKYSVLPSSGHRASHSSVA
ncbi:MAG TPA: biotin transporter BioY [Bacteroidota bacterium]|nr:biotin transporter BioY [Bacteroidota bacterium]